MKKYTKKAIGLLLAALFLLSIPCTAFAIPTENPVEPRWIVSCSSGGKHQMSPRAGGNLYSGVPGASGTNYGWGYINQCTVCREVLWSQYKPNSTYTLGYYYISPHIKDWVPYYGTTVYMDGDSRDYFGGNILTDSYWQGYEFLIN